MAYPCGCEETKTTGVTSGTGICCRVCTAHSFFFLTDSSFLLNRGIAIDVNPDKNQKSFNVMLECLSCWGIAIDVNPDKNQKSFNVMLECLSCWSIAIDVHPDRVCGSYQDVCL
jgi:hypothetical protein